MLNQLRGQKPETSGWDKYKWAGGKRKRGWTIFSKGLARSNYYCSKGRVSLTLFNMIREFLKRTC